MGRTKGILPVCYRPMITENDSRKRHCPMLGHEIAFSYCRAPGQQLPCRRIFDCWWECFDIKAFMESHYDAETLAKMTAPPPSKPLSLLELIEQAKKRVSGD